MTKIFRFELVVRVILAWLVSSAVLINSAAAHEVQPGVMDVEMTGDTLDLYVEWILEAPIAGLDLEGVADTNEAEGAEEYDRLRGFAPEALAEAFGQAWPDLQRKITVRAGDTPLELTVSDVDVPEVGDVELARTSTVHLKAALPADDTPLVIGWSADLGPLVVRQRNVDGGYAGYLVSGALSDPIPRTGGTDQSAGAAFADYIGVGFDHIVPKGLDHILFVLGLFFLSLHLRPLLWQVTAFTLAHTVTLALGALDIIRISPDIVEPLIAASIVYVAVENLLVRTLHPWRPAIVFGFGLLHGLGFASVLQDFGLGSSHFIPKLIGFNVGVEIGQLAVIATAFLTLAVLFGSHYWWHRRIAAPVSVAIAVIAAFWVLERTGLIDPSGAWTPFTLLTEGGLPPLWTLLGAAAVATLLTAVLMPMPGADTFRDVAGFLTSLVAFTAIVATFTSGAWIITVILAAVWVLAIRLQSLGDIETR
ncbi:HupE/UreJ family protein [Silicimonas sp. MF1-12-2]|uniref:HupE/UreJ family protein n=1 Tax=Silicimonas sp. MF1-12-2 TaxID=3384793 RepID=UPI0039B44083